MWFRFRLGQGLFLGLFRVLCLVQFQGQFQAQSQVPFQVPFQGLFLLQSPGLCLDLYRDLFLGQL